MSFDTQKKMLQSKGLVPWEVIQEAEDILQCIIPCSLVATALGGSGQVVGEEAGDLPGQPGVNGVRGTPWARDGRINSCNQQKSMYTPQK